MSNFKYTAGLNNVGSYQVSGIPYATGSLGTEAGLLITFPFVTQWVHVAYSASNPQNADLHIGFNANGTGGITNNYYILKPEKTTPIFNLKLSQIYLKGGENGGVSLMAGLTNIPTERVDNIAISGSNWSGSSGVG